MSYDYRPRANDPPSTPDAGSPGGDTSGAGGGVTILLTGTETEPGNFFRGDEDPADTPAYLAILEPGDKWTDTSLAPDAFIEKRRNAGNDDWEVMSLHVVDVGTGNSADIELDSTANAVILRAGPTASAPSERNMIRVNFDGSVSIGTNNASIAIGVPGDILIIGAAGGIEIAANGNTTLPAVLLTSLPTADPTVAGQLWADAGVVKVSAG